MKEFWENALVTMLCFFGFEPENKQIYMYNGLPLWTRSFLGLKGRAWQYKFGQLFQALYLHKTRISNFDLADMLQSRDIQPMLHLLIFHLNVTESRDSIYKFCWWFIE